MNEDLEEELKGLLKTKCEDFVAQFKKAGATDKEANMFAKGYLFGVQDGINIGQGLAEQGVKAKANIDFEKVAG